jgi:hypothetical protein
MGRRVLTPREIELEWEPMRDGIRATVDRILELEAPKEPDYITLIDGALIKLQNVVAELNRRRRMA